MTEEEMLDNKVYEILFTLAQANLISDWEFRNIDRNAIKAVFRDIKSPQPTPEEKRIWKIHMYSPFSHNKYCSDIKELTESEAVKWYNEFNVGYLIKGGLLYKKEGEWVTYNIGE